MEKRKVCRRCGIDLVFKREKEVGACLMCRNDEIMKPEIFRNRKLTEFGFEPPVVKKNEI